MERLLTCDVCGFGDHRTCLGVDKKAYAWGRGHIGTVCRVSELDETLSMRTDFVAGTTAGQRLNSSARASTPTPSQLSPAQIKNRSRLMDVSNVIRSRSFASSTWAAYGYWLEKVMKAEVALGQPLLPMGINEMHLFFTYLTEDIATWRAVRSARSAIRAWHIVAGIPEPFTLPEAKMYLTGLQRTVTLAARKKLPMKLEWVLKMLEYLWTSGRYTRQVALRDTMWLLVGFFGVRRHSEIVRPPGAERVGESKGLRRKDVILHGDAKRIELYIQRMKNDPMGKGHSVWLNGTTKSGVDIYGLFTAYCACIDLPADSDQPFLAATRGSAWARQPNGNLKGMVEYRSRLKDLLRHAIGLDDNAIKDYSAHSLRRGGVTHAYRQGVFFDHLNVHGSWLSGPAITGYREPSESQLCAVSASM
jgi:hypothetical protein